MTTFFTFIFLNIMSTFWGSLIFVNLGYVAFKYDYYISQDPMYNVNSFSTLL